MYKLMAGDLKDKQKQEIEFLYTNIGRGHPFYLDGIMEAIVRSGSVNLVRSQSDVFDNSSGVFLRLWETARWLYKKGSSGGGIGRVYESIRRNNSYDPECLSVRLLGRQIRKKHGNTKSPLVIAHPLLTAILSGRKGLIYQHGEVAVPSESVVLGADSVIVPTPKAAEPFIAKGYERSSIFVSGLCIEPALVSQAEISYLSRIQRIESDSRLTGAYYSSGAEPKLHIEAIARAALMAVMAGEKVIIFARKRGRLESAVIEKFSINGVMLAVFDITTPIPSELPNAVLVGTDTRREESRLTAQLFPYFDYFVGPSHERSNWALGLGLPMFVLLPTIGPFAPLNREILHGFGVAKDLDLVHYPAHRECLVRMANAGWKNYPIDGFSKIADYIAESFAKERRAV